MLLASGKWAAQCILQVVLRDAGRVEEVFAIDEFREGRAGGDARRAAVDLVAHLFDVVARDPDRKTSDVAARGVAGLAPAGGVVHLAGVARPDEMVQDLRSVTIRHE